jgi:hypothetical protein
VLPSLNLCVNTEDMNLGESYGTHGDVRNTYIVAVGKCRGNVDFIRERC